MLAVTLKNFGGPEVLTLAEMPTPEPKDNEILVQVKAAALNRADLLQRRGKYPPPIGESDVLGLEIAGIVKALGCDVKDIKVGDRVFGLVASGAYAEYCTIDHEVAMLIPDHFSYTEAAAIPEAFLTANEAIFTLGQLKNNESILIHAGGSGVGSAGIQIAKQIGATVFTTVGSQEKWLKAKELGADQVINYHEEDFESIVQEKGGVDVIIDFIGADYFEKHLHILKPGGRLICVGLLSGAKTTLNLDTLLTEHLQIKGLIMRTRTLVEKREIVSRFKEKWFPYLVNRKIHPVVDSIYPIHKVSAAHEHMEHHANFGKIVLQIEQGELET